MTAGAVMELVGPYMLIPFIAFLVLGIPVAFAIGFAVFLFFFLSGTRIPVLTFMMEMYDGISIGALIALPLFILTGEILTRADITDKLVAVANALVGWIRGGLGHVNIVTSMFFAGISGSAIADTASLGPILIPAMIRESFPRAFSAAITAASSIVGPIIPPSIPIIVIGAQLNISIGGLFAAGILPGIVVGLALMMTNYVICVRNNYGEVHPFEGVVPATITTFKAVPALLIPVILLGGILSGVFTPTEAGAVAASYAALVGAFVYRTLNLGRLNEALVAAARVTGSCMLILATAIVFSRILAFYKIPQEMLEFLLSISQDKVVLILLIIVMFLIIGMFMDALVNMIILGPLLMPVLVDGLGFHPLQFGIFLMVGLLLGLVTPPVGLCLFIASPIARASLDQTAYAVLPFLGTELVLLLIIAFVPELTLYIPRILEFA